MDEHFFMCFLVIWICSLEKFCLVQLLTSLLVHWFWGEFSFFELSVYSDYQSFVWCIVNKYFFPLCGWCLQFRDHFFCCTEAFQFHIVLFVHSFFKLLGWWSSIEEVLTYTYCFWVFPALLCTNCRVWGLILRSLIHFELTVVQDDRHGSSFSFLQADDHFSQQHLLKRLSFLHHIFLVTLSKIRWEYLCRFISGPSILFHWSPYLFFNQYHAVFIPTAL
jgi:hypothetical protein